MKKIISIMLAVCMLLCSATAVFATNANDVHYIYTSWRIATNMGTISPGTYVISSSTYSENQKNIMSALSLICSTRTGRFLGMGGCDFVAAGNLFVRFLPKTVYSVSLYDGSTGRLVWSGRLKSGDDLYLGADHSSYNVVFTSESGLYWTALVKK